MNMRTFECSKSYEQLRADENVIRLLYLSNVAFTMSGLSGLVDIVEPTSEKDILRS